MNKGQRYREEPAAEEVVTAGWLHLLAKCTKVCAIYGEHFAGACCHRHRVGSLDSCLTGDLTLRFEGSKSEARWLLTRSLHSNQHAFTQLHILLCNAQYSYSCCSPFAMRPSQRPVRPARACMPTRLIAASVCTQSRLSGASSPSFLSISPRASA